MSKNDVANGNVNASDFSNVNCDTKESKVNFQDGQPEKENVQEQKSRPQQNVRQIPIYVEGRDEPLMNNVDLGASFGGAPKPTGSTPEIPRPSSSIFSRVKDIPVKVIPNFDAGRRSASPATARNIPIHVQHSASKQSQHKHTQQQRHNISQDEEIRKSPSPCPQDPITKIQLIQKEIIHLMEKVEAFEGTKESKEYVYLDEMLTQNLLKLDTIDTDGKDNIKAARKEVINCINKCITALETKAGASATEPKTAET
ncbi:BAG domain-containing protein Samui-like [Condylostylus longicornis]|uniref:BAG domain-containing protein Samui-like n=1 Tax=Condylostylus longicornis TaxID=2530218 RepID=UPI00244DA266|nr:BAG domain-containing protein Samui-like [Condylostylus longicornis]